MFFGDAKKFAADAMTLKKDSSTCTPSFHLLSSLALELLPKTIIGIGICLKYKELDQTQITEAAIRTEIINEMRKSNHGLDELYSDSLKHDLGISRIVEFHNDWVWEYRFKMNNGAELGIKHIEAIRYGSFAKERNIATWCTEDQEIMNLLERLVIYVGQQREHARVELIAAYKRKGAAAK